MQAGKRGRGHGEGLGGRSSLRRGHPNKDMKEVEEQDIPGLGLRGQSTRSKGEGKQDGVRHGGLSMGGPVGLAGYGRVCTKESDLHVLAAALTGTGWGPSAESQGASSCSWNPGERWDGSRNGREKWSRYILKVRPTALAVKDSGNPGVFSLSCHTDQLNKCSLTRNIPQLTQFQWGREGRQKVG